MKDKDYTEDDLFEKELRYEEELLSEEALEKEKQKNASPKKKKRRSIDFGSYFLGFVIGLILMSISSIVILLIMKDKIYKNAIEQVQSATLPALSEDSENSLKDIEEKLEYLQQIIDAYYLFDIDYENMATDVYKALVDGLGDKYSAYYTADEYQALKSSTSGTYAGLGARVQKDEATGYVVLVSLFEGSGALEVNLEPGDMITAVEGESIVGMELSEITTMLKGIAGTKAKITVYRPSTGLTWDVEFTRREIELTSVASMMLDNNIGYIVISEFDGNTSDQFKSEVESLLNDGMVALVIDVRSNPGGLVSCVTKIADMLLPEGMIVYTEDKNGNRAEYKSKSECYDFPLALLVNGNSASASEILAGAIQDRGRGIIIGTQTFGKGIVQTIRPLSDGSAIKLTISKYFTPNGRSIHGLGITPDMVLEYDTSINDKEDVTWKDDNQVKAAYEYLLNNLK